MSNMCQEKAKISRSRLERLAKMYSEVKRKMYRNKNSWQIITANIEEDVKRLRYNV